VSGLVYSRTDSGLLVAEEGASDEKAVGRLLRDYDSDLRLVPATFHDGRLGYKVYRYAGPDRPAEFICYWGNEEGEPYPLSSRLLDKVRELDRNSRAPYLSEDELNARAQEKRERQIRQDAEDLVDDVATTAGVMPCFHRGAHLRRSRAKTGYHEAGR
jgi:hypothetical protein